MTQYRIRGWFRDTLDTDSILRFTAENDEEAWKYELPPKFLSNTLERLDGGEWVKLKLAPEQFMAALSGVVNGIVSKDKLRGIDISEDHNLDAGEDR